MATPANLYPGLNDLVDVLEEIPLEVTKYLTLLYEIDAKCIHILPQLLNSIDSIFDPSKSTLTLTNINTMLEELIPSLEEKMHVSSIMCEIIDKLNKRLDLSYEVAIRNDEIPNKVRVGLDNHPAMHLHYELVQSLLHPQKNNRSAQSAKSESRREAMLANKKNESAKEQSNTPGPVESFTSTATTKRTNTNPSTTNTSTTNNNNNNNNPRKRRKTTKHVTPVPVKQTTQQVTESPAPPRVNEFGEPVYCYCNQVAYGEMVGCDGENCELEWFHLPCIGLTTLPKGKWYCDSCKAKLHN